MLNCQFGLRNINQSYSHKGHSLPIDSHYKSKKYRTPFKSLLTTHNTNNVTLSMYSLKSKSKTKPTQYSKLEKDKTKKASFGRPPAQKNKKRKQKARPNSYKSTTKQRNQSKSNFKPKASFNLEQEKIERSLKTNKQFYKLIRSSTDSHSTAAFLSKISDIFDLVTLNISLPAQAQAFLARPLNDLRSALYRNGRGQMATNLTEFKNGCMNIYRVVPLSEIAVFNRLKLPASNRWSSSGHASHFKRDQSIRKRQLYYHNLKKKAQNDKGADNDTLNRIEIRLDQFLDKSLKYRKVYI